MDRHLVKYIAKEIHKYPERTKTKKELVKLSEKIIMTIRFDLAEKLKKKVTCKISTKIQIKHFLTRSNNGFNPTSSQAAEN